MVGVSRRSRACFTCRQHKDKCDLQSPVCRKCIDSGRTCEGYARYPGTLNCTAQGIAKRKPREKVKRLRDTRSLPASNTSPVDAPTTARQRELPCNQAEPMANTDLQPGTGAAYEAQLISTFWDHFIPQQSGRPQAGCQCKWLQQALDLPNPSPALRLSLKALAMARIGWINRDDTFVRHGRVLYGQALQAIQKALYDEHAMWQDDTLATGNVLAWYEFYEPTNDSIAGWNSHTHGVARLMFIRGLDRHRSPFGRALLEGIRLSAMIQALQNRKASPVGNHEWCTRPWVVEKRRDRFPDKDATQRLYDHGFALAALFEEIDKANLPNPETKLAQFNKLLRRCSALDATFNLWYQDFAHQYQYSTPLYWLTPPNDGIDHIPAALDKWRPFSFPDLSIAIAVIVFWGLKLALSNTVAIICALILSPNVKNQHEDDPQGFAALEQTAGLLLTHHGNAGRLENATNIIRAMPYCLHDSAGQLGPQRCLFPLRAALLSLRRTPGEELDMCLKIYQELVEKKGVGYAREVGKVSANQGAAAGGNSDAISLAPGHGECVDDRIKR